MIKYWIKILKENESSLLKKVYMMLWEDTDINLNYNGKNWASQIKTILQQHGFEYIWPSLESSCAPSRSPTMADNEGVLGLGFYPKRRHEIGWAIDNPIDV